MHGSTPLLDTVMPSLLRCLILATFGLLPLSGHPAGQASAKLEAEAGGFSAYRLNNGFKIILVPYPAASSVRVELLVKTGSKQEGYGETGMAHLLEHMLFKGAGKRPNLKNDLTALGAQWNGTTNADRTNYFETLAADPEKLDEALRIEADRFIRARFTQDDLRSEMTVVRNELERNDTNPNSVVMRALQRQAFFWHGYGRPTIGARSDIEDAPFSVLQAFHRRHYRPDNAALIVSGNFDPQRVLKLASQLFSVAKNPAAAKPDTWTREEAKAVTNRSEITLPAGTTIAASTWKLPGQRDPRVYAFDLGVTAICDQDWGSLRKDLVLDRKLAVNTECGTQLQSDYSQLIARASAGQDADAEKLGQALREHIQQAAARGIDAQQLERARQAELNNYERVENDHESLASQFSQAEVAGDWRLYFWQRETVRKLQLTDVNDSLRAWVLASNRADVLLHHGNPQAAPVLGTGAASSELLKDGQWPPVVKPSDAIPGSAGELARLTQNIELQTTAANARLISRKPQGELAWLVIANDFGNQAALSERVMACTLASGLMANGGGGLNRDQLDARLQALQANWSLSLNGIHLEAPRRNIEAALDILLAVWKEPLLPEAEFDRLRAAMLARLQASLKDPAQLAANQASLRFNNYPSGHPKQALPLSEQLTRLQATTYGQIQQCVQDFGGRSHLRIGAAGDFRQEDIQGIWRKVAELPQSAIPYSRIPDMPAPSAAEVQTQPIVISLPAKPNAMIVGQTLLPITDRSPDFPALRIASKILGGDAQSRIWNRLREKEGLAYSASASLNGASFEARSTFSIQASAASPKADAALSSLQAEFQRALAEGFTEQEVARAKQTWLEERKTMLRNESSFASVLAQGMLDGHDYAWLADYDQRIGKVTAQEATRVFRKYLGSAPMLWSTGRGE